MKIGLRIAAAVVLGSLMVVHAGAANLWKTDFAEASAAAKESNRYLLLDFSGSDWCGWCMKLDKEVFSQSVFREYAAANLVCVLLDFPRGHELKKSLKEQNEAMAKKYGVRGFPTVLILSPSGELVRSTGYQEGGAERYVEHLKGIIDPHRQKNGVPAPTPVKEKGSQSSGRPSLKKTPAANP
jgi:thioredoxin-related protein